MATWVGVVSHDHVRVCVTGGFCQLNHGKEAPLRRLKAGDHIIYYSPREQMGEGEALQAFTAIGVVQPGEPYQVDQTPTFHPFRLDVKYFESKNAPIRPLLDQLSFSRGRTSWGMILRRGTFPIEDSDYELIAHAMGVRNV